MARAEPRVHPPVAAGSRGYPVRLERAPARRSLLFRDADDAQKRNRPFDRRERERPRRPAARDPLADQPLRAAARQAQPAGRSSGKIVLGLHRAARSCSRSASAGGAYLYYHQSVAAVAAHSKDVKVAQKRLDIAAAEPAGDRARRRLRQAPRRHRPRPLRHADAAARRPDDQVDLDAVVPARPGRADLWCGKHQYLPDRINDAYALCGSKGALDTVKHLTGLPINYLITVNFRGFIEIVDRVGGVWVDVDRRYFNKNVGTEATNFSNIDLQPGYQLLKGRDALAYVRYRHTDSDLYRLARQQQFVKALKQQISSNFSVWKIARRSSARSRTTSRSARPAAARSRTRSSATRSSRTACRRGTSSSRRSTAALLGTNELTASTASIQPRCSDFADARRRGAAERDGRRVRAEGGRREGAAAEPHLDQRAERERHRRARRRTAGVRARAARLPDRLSGELGRPQRAELRVLPHEGLLRPAGRPASQVAARKVADLFGDARGRSGCRRRCARKAQHAMVTVVVGSTFHGTLAPAPIDKTPKKQPPEVRSDPGQTRSLLRSVRRKVDFPLMVPNVARASTRTSTARCRSASTRRRRASAAVRLTFLTSHELAGYWGIEETSWDDAPALAAAELQAQDQGPRVRLLLQRRRTCTWSSSRRRRRATGS